VPCHQDQDRDAAAALAAADAATSHCGCVSAGTVLLKSSGYVDENALEYPLLQGQSPAPPRRRRTRLAVAPQPALTSADRALQPGLNLFATFSVVLFNAGAIDLSWWGKRARVSILRRLGLLRASPSWACVSRSAAQRCSFFYPHLRTAPAPMALGCDSVNSASVDSAGAPPTCTCKCPGLARCHAQAPPLFLPCATHHRAHWLTRRG
jgi:hypothetical protein